VDDCGFLPTDAPKKLPDKGLVLMKAFHLAMQGMPYLGAVIPACLDREGRDWLESQPKGLTVAMHGFRHQQIRPGLQSEFAEVGFVKCDSWIEAAKKMLKVPTQHFVAPFNSYTTDLSNALLRHGFNIHWMGISESPDIPMIKWEPGLTEIWCWSPLYSATLWKMSPESIPLVRTLPSVIGRPGTAVICLHITWEAAKCDNDFTGIRWLVDQVGDRLISPDEFLR
jgi:hypothetical protein